MLKNHLIFLAPVFPVFVAVLSIINIYNHSADLFVLSNLLSLMGIAGTVLFF
jgi:hypothetical protein